MDRRRLLTVAGGIGLGTGIAGLGISASAQAASYPYFNRRIPDAAHTQIGLMSSQGITSFSFTPSNGWVIVTQTGGYYASGIPSECYTKLGQMIANGTKIHCVAFPPAGGNSWVIAGDNDMFARNIPNECYTKMQEFYAGGQQVVHVGFPPGGGNSWVVVGTSSFFARGIDDECYQMMRNLSQGGRKVTRVSFPYTGGWAVVAQDEFYVRNIDNECYQQMQNFRAGGWQLHNVAFSPVSNGWSLISRGQAPALPVDKIRQIEASVGGTDIWNRMANYKTPGLAIAVVLNNQIAWSTGYGWLESGQPVATHPESAFQACSISKAVATIGILNFLSGARTVGLNSDIRPLLAWQLPKRPCVSANTGPTIDQLLGHRGGVIGRGSTSPTNVCSGFTANVGGGFGGYGPNATVPTLLEILNGQGNSPKIELSTEPGAAYYYSGMGFELLHRMMEVQTGQTLAAYMQTYVFPQLGMNTSSYSLTPPFQLAAGHTKAGAIIPGKRYRYPESAAAGLYTTVLDLCRMIKWINAQYTAPSELGGPLNKAWVTTMLSQGATPGMGRGVFTANVGTNNFSYAHNGDNFGFKTIFTGYPNLGTGFAIMCNGDDYGMINDVTNSIKSVYGWS